MSRSPKASKEIPTVTPRTIRYDSLKRIEPLTPAQEELFREYNNGQNLVAIGMAGTGKTFLSIYLSLKEILLRESNFEKIVMVRSVVPVRDEGFLPGSIEEKELVYQLPYHAIFKEILKGNDVVEKMIHQNLYEFISTSYIRGITLHNSIVIVDECENLDFHELETIITRLGNDCKIIFCGDGEQTDFKNSLDKAGLGKFLDITEKMNSFSRVDFGEEDIVRSGLVKEYLVTKHRLGIS